MNPVRFHSIMHFAQKAGNATNAGVKDIDVSRLYLENARALGLTLKRWNYALTVHTNDVGRCQRVLSEVGGGFVAVEAIHEQYAPPEDVRFYSAHQKLNLYHRLAVEPGVNAVVDLDMIMLGPLPEWFFPIWNSGFGTVYNISSQVIPSEGLDRVRKDIELLVGAPCEGHWYGGEFIAGSSFFWKRLVERIEVYWPRYTANYKDLFHQGDEALSSAALQLSPHGAAIAIDVGAQGVVQRYWSVATNHQQSQLGDLRNLSLLHLPADKRFIAAAPAAILCDPKAFLRRYSTYRLRRILLSRAKKFLQRFARR